MITSVETVVSFSQHVSLLDYASLVFCNFSHFCSPLLMVETISLKVCILLHTLLFLNIPFKLISEPWVIIDILRMSHNTLWHLIMYALTVLLTDCLGNEPMKLLHRYNGLDWPC